MSNNEIDLIIEEINSYKQFSDIDIEKIVDFEIGYAFRIAKFAKDKTFKFNQLRVILDSIKRIEQTEKEWDKKRIEFYLLKPRLAVAVTNRIISPEINDVIISAMDLVDVSNGENNLENFKYFVYFFESIMAYYKFLEVYDD